MRYRFALWSTMAMVSQKVFGGVGVDNNTGFVCPNRPLCDGQGLPKLTELVLLKIVHGFSALAVSIRMLGTTLPVDMVQGQ